MNRCAIVGASIALAASVAPGAARAQDEIVASNSWRFGQTAGIRGQLRGEPGMAGDVWVIEDFGIDVAAELTRFESSGTVNPVASAGAVEDVVVQIRDAMPPAGRVILESVAGTGEYVDGSLGQGRFRTEFGGQRLEAGDYIIMWAAELPGFGASSIMWHQPGAHDVGRGEPDNGFYWKPDTGEIIEVPLQLGGGGRSGLNFMLRGIPDAVCLADCDEDGQLTFFDFLCFQNLFAAGDPLADCDGDGMLNFFDFLCFQNAFAAGCE